MCFPIAEIILLFSSAFDQEEMNGQAEQAAENQTESYQHIPEKKHAEQTAENDVATARQTDVLDEFDVLLQQRFPFLDEDQEHDDGSDSEEEVQPLICSLS